MIGETPITVQMLLDNEVKIKNIKGDLVIYKKKDLKYDIEHGYFRLQPECEICYTLLDVDPFCLCQNLCGDCVNGGKHDCQECNPNGLPYIVISNGLYDKLVYI